MTTHLVDSHAHLNAPQFDEDRSEALRRARDAGVLTVIDVGTEPKEWRRSIQLAAERPEISCVLGLHPNSAALWSSALETELHQLLEDEHVVAVGETGLDYYRLGAPAEVQREVFIAHLQLARAVTLPVVIHARDAYEDILQILHTHGQGTRGVLHSFAGRVEEALRGVDLGYYVSLSGPVTYKSGEQIRAVAAAVPLDRLLVETDSPYLPPHPFRGKRNEPAYVTLTIEALAQARGTDWDAIAHATTENAMRLFQLPRK